MAASDESRALLKDDLAQVYNGEMEPEQKSGHVIAEGLPVKYTPVTVVAAPRQGWSTGLFYGLSLRHWFLRNDNEWSSTDSEICVLGTFAPCVLHASNRERLAPGEQGQFKKDCCFYTGLYLIGKIILKGNFVAPLFSYPTRVQLRQKYNLQGNGDYLRSIFGCQPVADPAQREKEEGVYDCLIHYWCHPCAVCQEAREIRRRLPHPVRAAAPLAAPAQQVM